MLRPHLTRFHYVLFATALAGVAILAATSGALRIGLLIAVAAVTGTTIGLGVSFPQWQFFGYSLCCVRTSRKTVALTFDDGPDSENTPALLDLLAGRKIHATFFCVGRRAAQHPELTKRLVAEGHEVENHSFLHSPMTNLFPVQRLREDLAQTQEILKRITGRTPEYFRPPVGLTNPRIFHVTRTLGLKVAGYSARGLDRRADSPEKIVGRLLAKLQPGAVFLLHDAGVPGARLLAVVRLLLDKLQAEGYQCVRLDELADGEECS